MQISSNYKINLIQFQSRFKYFDILIQVTKMILKIIPRKGPKVIQTVLEMKNQEDR